MIVLFLPDRVKQLKGEPYTQKVSDAAVGLWTDNGRGKPDTESHADVDMAT